MQGLKLSQLKEGHIYQCLLSGKNVMVCKLIGKPIHSASCYAYSDVVEQIDTYEVIDYQLSEIEEDTLSQTVKLMNATNDILNKDEWHDTQQGKTPFG